MSVPARLLAARIRLARGEATRALADLEVLAERVRSADPAVWRMYADAARAAGRPDVAQAAATKARLLEEGVRLDARRYLAE